VCRRRASSSDRLLMQVLYCMLVRQHGDPERSIAKHNRKSFRFIGTERESQVPSAANGFHSPYSRYSGPQF
jgi:hypothetical protein